MTDHIGFMFACVLALTSVYAISDGCFEFEIHYIGLGLPKPGGNNTYGPTDSVKGCQSLCQETDGCGWFNWEDEEGKCWLKTGKGNKSKQKPGFVTGPRICPTTTRKPIITVTTPTTTRTTATTSTTTTTQCFEQNIHYIGIGLHKTNNYGSTGSAEGCQLLCQQTDGCDWFNWEGKVDKCWLKTGRGNQTWQNNGGVTGPRICPEPVLLHVDSQYSYYKVPMRPGSALLSSVIKDTCEMHGMTPQCFIRKRRFTDGGCINAPNGKLPSLELAKIICGTNKPTRGRPLEHTFWYMDGSEDGNTWGVNDTQCKELLKRSFMAKLKRGKDINTSSGNQYFAACLLPF